jgi:hypothetical protein
MKFLLQFEFDARVWNGCGLRRIFRLNEKDEEVFKFVSKIEVGSAH